MKTLINIPIAAAALLLGVQTPAIADSHRDPSFNAPHGYSRALFNLGAPNTDIATDVAVQELDGKVVLAGVAIEGDPGIARGALVRLKADGSVDGDFGVLGRQTFQVAGRDTRIRAVAMQDDKIIVAGQWSAVGGNVGFVARLTATGLMDATFGPNASRWSESSTSAMSPSSVRAGAFCWRGTAGMRPGRVRQMTSP